MATRARNRLNSENTNEQSGKETPEYVFSRMIAHNEDYSISGEPGEKSLLYRWDGLIWQQVEKEEMDRMALSWLCSGRFIHKATPAIAKSCAEAAIMAAREMPKFNDENKIILPVNNGYLHINLKEESLEIKYPEKEYGIKYLIKCDFNINADSPEFNKFIRDVLPNDDVRNYVQEYVGYTLMPDPRFQTGIWFMGAGSNGKSTLVEIIAALHEKVSTISLDNMDGFALTSLINASLVWVDETPKKINEQKLKTLISGGPTQIDRKFKDLVSVKPFAKWIICGNDLPIITDPTDGFWRRFAIVQFEKIFTNKEKDVMLAKRIIKNELSGVLNWAIAGLIRLVQRGKFPEIPEKMREALESGKRETNNVLAWWLDGRAEICEECETSKKAVYADYQMYAKETGTASFGAEKFWRRLKMIVPQLTDTQKRINGDRDRVVNLRLTNPVSAMAPDY